VRCPCYGGKLTVACADGDEDGALDVCGRPADGVEVSGHVEEAARGDLGNGADVAGGVARSAGVDDETLADDPGDVEPAATEDVDTCVGCAEQSGGAGDAQEGALVVVHHHGRHLRDGLGTGRLRDQVRSAHGTV
jgi:hypothetical protein